MYHKSRVEELKTKEEQMKKLANKVAAFLASDDAGWITGETIVVSGGNI